MSATTRSCHHASWSTPSPSDVASGVPYSPLSAERVGVPGVHRAHPAPGGLRMSQEFQHRPVFLEEVLDLLAPLGPGLVVDATLGAAGHAAAILRARDDFQLLGCDQDPDAVAAAAEALAPFAGRARVRQARFDELPALVAEDRANAGLGDPPPVVAVLFDLGVSSPQLDRPERGFSYRSDGPLDMRMDPGTGRSAAELVNTAQESELATLFAEHGEERLARRIARAVVAARPLTSTTQLAEVVASAVPAALRRRGHPARRVFQALRVAVNQELEILPGAIDDALQLLAPGGRCIVLAYHSGEDRIVKERFRNAVTGGCTCPPGLPCVCGADPQFTLLTRGARKPSAAEVEANPRAEAARLRAVERMGGPAVERTRSRRSR
ncbi:MAG: Ribosomal small subunit methyltransferase [Acidimicrobiaceae bacterium]|nr:Ribosomal small subunit methyltransferase [Acidimicrobiaceae bacterium]